MRNHLTEAESAQDTREECTYSAEQFAQLVSDFLEIKELNADILNTLVQRIVVHQRQSIDGDSNGQWTQQVDIYFKFIGMAHILV